MAGCWLLKTEPGSYSYADLEKEGRTVWDGVKNNLALKHMRRVARGDEVLFYHTGKEKAIVGVARIESAAYPDPEADEERIVVFDISPVRSLRRAVTLHEIKEAGGFPDWELVRAPRLSVMPVPKAARDWVLARAKRP